MAILKPGDIGVDYSGARPSGTEIRNAGGKFIMRYSAGAGNTQSETQWKLCGVTEIHEAVNRGLDFIANSEWYEGRITEGHAAGVADGAHDLAFWKSRGLNKGASIYVSWDAAPVQNKWPSAIAYLQGYNDELQGYYHVDCYAGTPFLKHALSLGVIRYGWRPNAGSWSGDGLDYQPGMEHSASTAKAATSHTPAHLWQTGNYWFSKGADENVILRTPVGSHLDQVQGSPPKEFKMDAASAKQMQTIVDGAVNKIIAAVKAADKTPDLSSGAQDYKGKGHYEETLLMGIPGYIPLSARPNPVVKK